MPYLTKYLFGQEINVDEDGVHTYKDTGEVVKTFPNECIDAEDRKCPYCNLCQLPDGIDPCFKGKLPGVRAACCGHGQKDGYIMFENEVGISMKIYMIYDIKADPLEVLEF